MRPVLAGSTEGMANGNNDLGRAVFTFGNGGVMHAGVSGNPLIFIPATTTVCDLACGLRNSLCHMNAGMVWLRAV